MSKDVSLFFAIESHVTPLRTGITSFNPSNPQNSTKDHEKTKFVGLCYEPYTVLLFLKTFVFNLRLFF